MSHRDINELLVELKIAKDKVRVGDRYFHYKHPENIYSILRVGFIESTEEVCVIYEAEFGEKLVWVRTLPDFLAKVKLEDGNEVDRFIKID